MYIIVPPQGYYGDFATVTATSADKEEAIAIAEKEGGVAYLADGYSEGEKVPRSAIDRMRLDGRLVERERDEVPSMLSRLRRARNA